MADSDTDSDILEATVHGTQDTCKKYAAVVIKTEDDSTYESEDSSVLEQSLNAIQYDLPKTLVVYTTRLDDMNAFKKNKSRSCKEAAEIILAESKPRYVQKHKKIDQTPLNNILRISYIQLCSYLQQHNIKAKIEAREKIAKALKMCKPLNIVLTDIMKTTMKPVKSTSSSHNTSSICHDDKDYDLLVPAIYCSDDNLPLSDIQRTKAMKVKCNQKTTITVRQNQSKEADIYILNNGLISYYRINFTEFNALHKAHGSEKLVLLQYCCWVKREESIKIFIKTHFIAPFDASFMRRPHSCKPKYCMCCCSSRVVMPIEPNDFKEALSTKPVVEISEQNNLIERAYKYIQENVDNMIEDQDKLSQTEESECYLKCAVIVIKYLAYRVIFEQTKLLGEYYVIGNNGMIESYVKPMTNRSYKDAIVFLKKSISKHEVPTKYLQQLICCWYKREEVLDYMRYRDNLSPNALRFIKSPHLCKSDQCKCCCKSKLHSIRLENITIQKNLYPSGRTLSMKDIHEHVSNKKKMYEHDSKEKRHPFINTEKTPDINMEPNFQYEHFTKNNTKKANRRNKRKTIRKNTRNVIKNNIIDLTDEPLLVQAQGHTKYTVTPNREFVDVSKLQNSSGSIANSQTSCIIQPGPNTSSIPYSTAINNIALKDLKLSVNNNGKLIATVNSRPECLTSVELKVISDILAHASKQITQLGLTPEDFCKQVNSVRAANLNSLLAHQATQAQAVRGASPVTPKSPAAGKKRSSTNCDRPAEVNRANVRAQPFAIDEPSSKTINTSLISKTYQNMSFLGGHKSMHLLHAYWLYCQGSQFPYKNSSVESIKKYIPEMVQSLNGSLPDRLNTKSSKNNTTAAQKAPAAQKAKRKWVEMSTNTNKRLRIIAAEELLNVSPPFKKQNVDLRPVSNPCNDSNFRNQRISDVNVTQSQPMMTTNQPPPLVNTNSLSPILNSIKLVASAKHNQESSLADQEPDVSANNPILYRMLSNESMPPLVPIGLDLQKNRRSQQRVISNEIKPTRSTIQNSDYPSEKNKGETEMNKTISAEPVSEGPATVDSVLMDLVVFSDERDDGIFGA